MGAGLSLVLVIGLLLFLIASRVPVAFSLAVSGTLGLVLVRGVDFAAASLGGQPYTVSANYSLLLIPMFVLMGMLALNAGIAQSVYEAGSRYLRRLPGGLGIATIGASAGFAAVTGSSAATVATIGRISINEMRRHGYSAAFAAGIVASGGTLGVLIPPSVVLVLYGILARESIGGLLLAGILPGVLSALLYIVVILWRNKREVSGDNARAFAQSGLDDTGGRVADAPRGHVALAQVLVLFGIVVGGIYSGLFTATESGAIAAFVALLFLVGRLAMKRGGGRGGLATALGETVSLTSMIFMLVIGGSLFALFIVTGGYADALATTLLGLDVPGWLLVACLLLAVIPLGMFLDGFSILFIVVPLAHPVIVELGYSGIWFGVMLVKMIEIGLITPPVGINIFVAAGAAPGVSVTDGFRGVWPFGLMDLVTVAVLFAFPVISTALPAMSQT
jgi:C4-dicarboxylate transporter, DctM subunit